MSHILTLKVPDDVFSELESKAFALGVEVEDFCLERLKIEGAPEDDPLWKAAGSVSGDALLSSEGVRNHPLMKLIGITTSPVNDLADRHDFYLAEEMMNTHEDEN